jgi:hypothetical protein
MFVGLSVRSGGLMPIWQPLSRTAPESRAEPGSRQNPLRENGNDGDAPYLERATQLKEILKRIEASKPDIAAERREAAKRKILEIRNQIEMLRMSLAGDPKAVARQAASLSRDLAAAVREYAAAGGTDGGGASVPSSSPQAAQPDAAAQGTEGAAANAPATGGYVDSGAENAAADIPRNAPETADAATGSPSDDSEQPAESIGPAAASTAAAKQAEELNRQREKDEFIRLARMTMDSLKALMRQAIAALSGEDSVAARHASAQADAALNEAESDLQSI